MSDTEAVPLGAEIEITRTQRYKVVGYDGEEYPDMLALGVSDDVKGVTYRFAHGLEDAPGVKVEVVDG